MPLRKPQPDRRRALGAPRRVLANLGVAVLLAAGVPIGVQAQSGLDDLPAGSQFPAGLEELPDGFQVRDPNLIAARDGVTVVLGTSGGDANEAGDPTVAVRSPEGAWTTAEVDDLRGYRHPKGMSVTRGFWPVAIASGPSGYVAIARALWFTSCRSSCAQEAMVVSLIWSSPDGITWRRIDPRAVVGSRATLALSSVTATDDSGWMAVGSTTTNLRKPSRIAVLTSPDGVSWSRAATIAGPRSLEPQRLFTVGETVLMEGMELVCTKDSTHHSLGAGTRADTTGGRVEQLRLWRADLARVSDWTPVTPTVEGVLEAPPPRSITARDCARRTESEVQARIRGSGFIVGAAAGQVVAASADVTRVAVTSDLERWTVAELPGSTPGEQTTTARGVRSVAVEPDAAGGLALLSLEARRDQAEDHVLGGAAQVLSWRSADGGAAWTRQASGRPFYLGHVGASPTAAVWAALRPLGDGTVALLASDTTGVDPAVLRMGEPGPLVPWGTCDPAPAADCSFSVIDRDMVGADLTAIDLTGAMIGYGSWDGVVLQDANLRGARINADLTGADLTGAQAADASMWADVTGVIATDADLRNARFGLILLAGAPVGVQIRGASIGVPSQRPEGVVLADLDLTGAWFQGPPGEVGDLRAVDFGEARMEGVWFSHVDLTGARLGQARFTSLSFSDVTCPDGKPMTAGAYGLDACRIKAR